MSESSFRDVPFKTVSVSIVGGRGGPVHEFIGTKNVFPEDTGGLPERFTINGHLIGDNVRQLLEDFKAALDVEGPGVLVHPYGDPVEVQINGAYSIDHDVSVGGMVGVSIPFVKSGDPLAPTLELDTGFDLDAKIDYTISLLDAETLDVSGPGFLETAAFAVLVGSTRLTGKILRANSKIGSTIGIVTDLSSAVDDFTASLNTFLRTPSVLALELIRLSQSLFNAISLVDSAAGRGDETRNVTRTALALSEMKSLVENDVEDVNTTTTTRERQQVNQDVLLDTSEIANLSEGLRSLGRIPLDNIEQADQMLTDALELLDGIIDRGSLNDGLDAALRDMRASFIIHIRTSTVDLNGLGEFTPPVDMPALAIAWDLYSDATRDQEIIERNHTIEDPGSVHGGVTLQVPDA